MKNLHCAICGKTESVFELYPENYFREQLNGKTFSARRTPDRMHYRFVKCRNCNLIFSNPILEEKEIKRLYSVSSFTYSLESKYVGKTYLEYFLRNISPPYNDKRVLDVGCGNGFFLDELQKIGVKNVYGIEPGKSSVKSAPERLKSKIKLGELIPGSFINNSFDVVCCFHTLDHVVDPNSFIKNARDILKKKGKILFIVHDTNGLSVKLFGEKSAIFDIEHIYLFNQNNLKKIFRLNGFRNVKTFKVKNRYPLIYWVRMVPFPLTLKKALVEFLRLSKLGNIPFSVEAGNIGVVATK